MAWTNFRILVRGQWIEAEVVYVRGDTDGDGGPGLFACLLSGAGGAFVAVRLFLDVFD
ncbi:hypothetical protein [Streptomyces sp. NPDC058086]|uniref:hypothetical protein n=1 Tax=Streptomyces sp. NPDC058086 TaxID=3346334 RepID=UPI0036E240CB